MVAQVHTSDECDSKTIQDFKNGDLPIVCQVGKLTEGFDMPNLDMTINYPTASFVREAQGAARCLRLPKVDSKTPGIMPKKMGLVVDIAFKHPDYDNIVDAIRQNGQILFQDVVGAPIAQHDDKRLRVEEINPKNLKTLRDKVSKEDDERLSFTVISHAQELMRLTREANKLADERYVPPIRPGMRSSTDFKRDFKVAHETIALYLQEAYDQRMTFFLDSDKNHEQPLPLVEQIRTGGQIAFALHEAPEALQKFIEIHPELRKSLENSEVPSIRPGMRTARDLTKELRTKHSTVMPWLKKAYDQHMTFFLDSDKKHEHPLPLVERVKRRAHITLALHEAPEATGVFKKWVKEVRGIELGKKFKVSSLQTRLKALDGKSTSQKPDPQPNTPEI